ncbi:uncharacterized protein [Medicago truncatula]|uniref:uncharacterized protein n=1 Tax=Medicago truncatula TaxID=3880 RepID=UPI000D2F1519|nr:uncharacterized protein LOC112416632 [Medicago truncatula]
MSRLDRFLLSEAWVSMFPNCIQMALSRSLSDHCPLLLTIDDDNWGPKPLRMLQCWSDIPGYGDFVKEKWHSIQVQGWRGFILKEKLKELKHCLRSWHLNHTLNIDSKIQEAQDRMAVLDALGENNSLGDQEVAEIHMLSADILAYSKLQTSMQWQKSRVNWLKAGDANSKFFHGIMASRKRVNSIISVLVDGVSIEGVEPVRQTVFQHFQNHFKRNTQVRPDIGGLVFKSLSGTEGADLVKPFLMEEIKAAVWDCDSFKSPGPDVLANRLRRVVGNVVSGSQSAFIKGRQILDGILIANELVDDAKCQKKDLLMFKVDFEKAYDSVDWGYLEEVMVKMNFPRVWRVWIMECVTTATASVLVNGCPTDEFHFERGLRQGDPLSPFLFLLAAEGLHVMMSTVVTNNIFTPYSVGAQVSVSVSHLQFADDTLLIGVKSWANVRAMKAVLLLFEAVSGLKVNFHKSMLFGVNVNDSWLHEAAVVMHCKHGRLPFLYLGLPIGGDPRKIQFWYPLVERIRSRLSGWKYKNLSLGGRLVLLKSVLSSIPVYYLSFFKAPSENGGLGVKRLKEFNISLLGKWVWRVLEDRESLWNVVLRAKYGEVGGRVWFCEGVGSIWWRHLNHIRSGVGLVDATWLLDNIVRKVGDGCTTTFWEDPWLLDVPLAVSFSRLFGLSEFREVTVREMFLLGWGVDGGAWRWRRRLFAWEEELVGECVVRLANFVLQDDLTDRWVWRLHSSQTYTVHSAYAYLTAVDFNITAEFTQFLWLKPVPLKVNIFVWRLFLNRLATKDNLRKRNVLEVSNVACAALCGKEEERDHLFFQCDHYGRLWLLISNWFGIVTVFHGTLFSHTHQFCALGGFSKKSTSAFTIIWISVLFVIWKDRNRRIFQNQHEHLEALSERVKLRTYWWLKANFIMFNFEYSFWRQNPLHCLQTVL